MEHILELLRDHGFEEVVVTVAFLPQAIRSYFGDGSNLGMEVEYSVEETPLGTAGSVRLASDRLDSTTLIISGDALCDIDLTSLVARHRERGAAVTIGLMSVENPLEFGIVVTDEDGRVERFLEKPSWGQVFSDTINTGIYVLEPEVLRHVPRDRPYDFSTELFPLLLEMGRPIYGHVCDGYWQDIGNLDQYRQANFDALDEKVRLQIPGMRLRGNIWIGEGVELDRIEEIEGPAFIGADCRIAPDAEVDPYSVLASGVTLREHARVARSIIDAGTYVGRAAIVEGAVVGANCDIRTHARLHEGVAIGNEVIVGDQSVIFPGVRIYPYKEVESGAQLHESLIWESRASSRLFTGSHVSGLVNVDLTPDVAVRLGAALGTALKRGSRVVATRESASVHRVIKASVISGLNSAGVHVVDLRTLPSPIGKHWLDAQNGDAAFHVGFSSVDPEAIEISIFERPGIAISAGLQREVEKHYARQELRRVPLGEIGELTYPPRAGESYAEALLGVLDVDAIRGHGLRIAVDYGYSSSSLVLPLVLDPLGVESVTAHPLETVDAVRSRERDETLERTTRLVSAVGAHLGAAFDRAGERLYLVDERGRPVALDQALLLFVRLLAWTGRTGRIAVPVTATSQVEVVAEGGLEVVRTQASLPGLTQAATGEGMLFAGATRGGYVFPEFLPAYDSVASLCKLLELLAKVGKPLSELVEGLPQPTLVHHDLQCPWALKGTVMRVLNERFADGNVDLLDGIKVFEERGWTQALPDPDAPLIHLYAEGRSAEESEELERELQALVESVIEGEEIASPAGNREPEFSS
jgi:mannose-1-phosphate guanylyltransferase/phosphomannomutase